MTNEKSKHEVIEKRKYTSYEELYSELSSLFQGEFVFCKVCNNIHRAHYCCNECGYGDGNATN